MVSMSSIISMCVTLFIIFVVPVIVCIIFAVKKKFHIVPLLVGMAVFFLFQMASRIPLLSMLSEQSWFTNFRILHGVLYALVLALSAGVFEEVGRYLAFKVVLKKHLSYENGIIYGIGHGWFEAMCIVGLTYINNLIYSLMINNGTLPQNLMETLKPLITMPSYMFLMAGFERAMTMTCHVMFSLIVLYGVMKKKDAKYLLYAVLAHAALDFPVGLTQNTVIITIILILYTVAAIIAIIKSKGAFKKLKAND